VDVDNGIKELFDAIIFDAIKSVKFVPHYSDGGSKTNNTSYSCQWQSQGMVFKFFYRCLSVFPHDI